VKERKMTAAGAIYAGSWATLGVVGGMAFLGVLRFVSIKLATPKN